MPKIAYTADDSLEYNDAVKDLSIFGLYKMMFKSLREFKGAAIATPIMVALGVVFDCSIPFVTAELVDAVNAGGGMEAITHYSLLLVLLALASMVCGATDGTLGARATTGLVKNLRVDMFKTIQNFSFANIDKFSNSSLVTRMTTDCVNVQNAFLMMIRMAFRGTLMCTFAVVMAVITGGKLALIYVVVSICLAAALITIMRRVMPLFRRGFHQYDMLNARTEENIKGIRVVKSYVREDYERSLFKKTSDALFKTFYSIERYLALNMPIMQTAVDIVYAFVVYFGSMIIVQTQGAAFNIGQLSALITYGFLMLMSLTMLSIVFMMVSMSEESARRICDVLVETSTIRNPEHPLMSVDNGSIEFNDVSFEYDPDGDCCALSHIDLSIASGETIGILGGTGSSKSTLIQLICRLYDVTKGSVSVAGHDVRDYDLEVLRDNVAVVLQKNVLFSGTIADNLRWGNKDASDEEVVAAAKLAQADEFVSTFPDGYNTYIEQGGSNVSGGQKQRLCIARALLKKPKILILDDSTSAVDTKTDRKIREGLKTYMPEVTKIIIAQRTSSIEDADRIIIMDKGKIQAIGTHNELLKTNEIYRETYISQNKQSHDERMEKEDDR